MKSLVFQEGKFSIKKEPAAALNRGKNPFVLTTLSKDPLILLSFDFEFLSRTITTPANSSYGFGRMQATEAVLQSCS